MSWRDRLDLDHSCWDGYRSLIRSLPVAGFPSPGALTGLLPEAAVTGSGRPVRFVRSRDLPNEGYEARIGRTGEVSTRENDLHDLFNALAWIRFPRIKSALNALHLRHEHEGGPGQRGPVRDALTLFDEGGAILASHGKKNLLAVASHDWPFVFDNRRDWSRHYRLQIVGHGLLEKCRNRYPAITANTLLLEVPGSMFRLPAAGFAVALDRVVAGALLSGDALASPRDLSPLPLMGIPGWWHPQDEAFYGDQSIFRPLPGGRATAPVLGVVDPCRAATSLTPGES